MMGLGLDKHQRPRAMPTEAERAKQAQEQRLAEIAADAELNYRTFLRRETPRCARYPHNATTWRLIAIELGPRAELWSGQNAGQTFVWEESDPRHPEGSIRLEGTADGDGVCIAYPTRRVRDGLREGWLVYRGHADRQNQPRQDITVEMAGQMLTASLERQFITQAREEILAGARDREARRRGSWFNVRVEWTAELEAELQRRLQEYRRRGGHLW